jgi:hypothetical protein
MLWLERRNMVIFKLLTLQISGLLIENGDCTNHPKVVFPPVEATAHFDFQSLTDSDCRPGFVTKVWCSFFSSFPTASLWLCRFKDAPAVSCDKSLARRSSSFRHCWSSRQSPTDRRGISDKSLVLSFFFFPNQAPGLCRVTFSCAPAERHHEEGRRGITTRSRSWILHVVIGVQYPQTG